MQPRLNIHSAILADPVVGPGDQASKSFMAILSASSLSRQDVWSNRAQATKQLPTLSLMRGWSPEACELYLMNALIPHPAHALPQPFAFKGVTTACARDHEAFIFRSIVQDGSAYNHLAALYASDIPTHLLYNAIPAQLTAKMMPKLLSYKPSPCRRSIVRCSTT
ncbi:hypothetical protein SISSUDRAFT_742740 [Sistotremastrum suecicum HHB10207 ss-3]|uniref:Uncharacterized protein n=1 Tax=Sistotremastrum suecicum HHB10207 ss-3 TaxID=1314776 RepID=A0A166HWD5_9AGAM|nr:hypothetical protein SISSUDRAFT_742740 [Sistotremastrum suecicum HHB10207 ss-3]